MRFKTVMKALVFVSIALFLILPGCGGGGGGGNGSGKTTGSTYTGKTTPATVTESNATQIMQDAFIDGMSGTGLGAAFGAMDANQVRIHPQIFRYLEKPVRDISHLVSNQSYTNLPRSISAMTTVPIDVSGSCGGTISGSMQVNEATGGISGSMVFNSYCEAGTTLNGTVTITGTVTTLGNYNLTMTFSDYTEVDSSAGLDLAMNGSVLMVSSYSSESMTMNVSVRDNTAGKVYWMDNYVITDTYYDYYDETEISGNFYSPDYGYVTLSTQEAFITLDEDYYPSLGVLIATGSGGTLARLTVLSATTYHVEADTNGDGTYEYDSGTLYWEE